MYAKWDLITYAITYDKNAADAVGTMENSSHTYDIDKNINNNTFTRTGYTFDGWARTAGGTVEFTDGATVKNLSAVDGATVTLYAKWNPISYTVVYNANGGTGTITNSSHIYDVEKVLNADAFTRAGYTFAGWTRTAGGTAEFANGQSVKNLTTVAEAMVTLYAVWVDSSTVWTVRFETNGGHAVGDAIVLRNTPVSRPAPDPNRTGYTFENWYADPELTRPYNFSSIVIEDITLYAKWNIKQYPVTFNVDGGTPAPAQQTIDHGSKVTEPATMTRTGYTFGGWFKENSLINRWNFANDTVTGTITLYAKWTLNKYSVTFNANSGTPAPAQQTIDHGGKVTEPSTMTRTGYTFGGWFKESGFTNQWNFANDTVAGAITLYAKWYSTVTFNANSAAGTVPASQTANAGSSITLPGVGNLTRTGYTFGGWNTNSTGTGTNYNAGASYTPTGNITLYAVWTNTVTYNINSGSGTTPTVQTVNAGANVTLPSGSGFSRTGYTFGGWNTNSSGTGTNYNSGTSYTPTGNITLYAKWTPNTAGITFDVKQIVDGAPIIAAITISRTNNGYPVTFPVSVNVSDYDAGSIRWEVAGVGAYAGQTVTGSGGSFTLNAAEIKYNSLGGHALILTVAKGGQQYQRAIPFTIVH
jgi:uncharacterized repeat protein (TIGR02543 family)